MVGSMVSLTIGRIRRDPVVGSIGTGDAAV
jgi:hypothetical protein